MIKIEFQKGFQLWQLLDALTNILNREATLREYQCTGVELDIHPEYLIQHYVENNGTQRYEAGREELVRSSGWRASMS